MKTITFLCLTLLIAPFVQATHLIGGYIRATPVVGSALTYDLTATLYLDGTSGTAAIAEMTSLSICTGDGTTVLAALVSRQPLPTDKGIIIALFQARYTYVGSGTYTLITMLTNRSSVRNITNSVSEPLTLSTTFLAAANQLPLPIVPGTNFRVGLNQRVTLQLAATDTDGDSLAYGLAKPLTSQTLSACSQQPVSSYQFPNDLTRRGTFSLNARTGELVWDAPTEEGRYAVALTVSEYRRGNLISQTIHELTLLVVDQPGTPGVVPPYVPASAGTTGSIVTTLPNVADNGIRLTVFPNPVDERLQVVVQTDEPATATVRLFDAGGRLLHEHRFGQAARHHEQVIGLGSLSPGLYLLHANVGGQTLIRKVVKR